MAHLVFPKRLTDRLAAYWSDMGGNMVVVTGIATLAIATASFAIDYGRKGSAETSLQKIADSAVAAAVSPAGIPADPKAAAERRREIIENYVRNSRNDVTDATLLGSPDIDLASNSISVTLLANFEGTWASIFNSFSSSKRKDPNLAVRAEAQWQ
ncbi:pilus assembly protein TadG-related protein [Aestuariivirga sp.]|uniref:pilus assembly protein TadG-related protein n=1 Tax=Aestuariivirga sp. TaxID=2650926 RepID=UPI00359314F1